MKGHRGVLCAAAVAVALAVSPSQAASVRDYMIIATGNPNDVGQAFLMSNSEIGAIGFNPKTSPPAGNPAFPAGTTGVMTGVIALDGDVAITHPSGTVTFSNSDVHALNTGPGNPGSQGVDCASSFNTCTDTGSQISSNNRFNQTGSPSGPASFSTLANNNGIQGGIALGGIPTELQNLRTFILGLAATHTFNITSDINTDRTDTFGSGLSVVDITTSGNNLRLNTANWIFEGNSDTSVIFRVNPGAVFSSQNGNLLLKGGIGVNNVLFFVDADEGEESFAFDNATFYGISLWDLGSDLKNVAKFNNVRGCGQIVIDQVNFQNVSMTGCSFDPSPVPIPGAAWLFASAVLSLGMAGWRARRRAEPGGGPREGGSGLAL